MFQYDELDQTTRHYMLSEFETDIFHNTLYLSKYFTEAGKSVYPGYLRTSILNGTEKTLALLLDSPIFWIDYYPKKMTGRYVYRKVREDANDVFADGEFNSFYIRAICRKLLDEGETQAEVYRAKLVHDPRIITLWNIGDVISIRRVLNDLRRRNDGANEGGIPRGPGSGISIRRIKKQAVMGPRIMAESA